LAAVLAWAALLTFAPLVWPQPGVAKGGTGPSGSVRDDVDPFQAAVDVARTEGKPLVLFVAIPVREVVGCVTVRVSDLDGNAKQRITVFRAGATVGEVLWPDASDKRIRIAAGLEQPIAAGPFLRPGEVPTADDNLDGGLPSFLADLEPYTTATRVQFTERRWSGVISSVSRAGNLELKWRVPGGLAGVNGWSSRLYRSKSMLASVFLVRQDPNDSVSAVTWSRNYPDGAVFADVLRNESGRVFEVRVAEKRAGEWERFVAYRDIGARPHGYNQPRRSECRACHDEAGRSEYGGAAVPGADTVISEPIPIVERGQSVHGGNGTKL